MKISEAIKRLRTLRMEKFVRFVDLVEAVLFEAHWEISAYHANGIPDAPPDDEPGWQPFAAMADGHVLWRRRVRKPFPTEERWTLDAGSASLTLSLRPTREPDIRLNGQLLRSGGHDYTWDPVSLQVTFDIPTCRGDRVLASYHPEKP